MRLRSWGTWSGSGDDRSSNEIKPFFETHVSQTGPEHTNIHIQCEVHDRRLSRFEVNSKMRILKVNRCSIAKGAEILSNSNLSWQCHSASVDTNVTSPLYKIR